MQEILKPLTVSVLISRENAPTSLATCSSFCRGKHWNETFATNWTFIHQVELQALQRVHFRHRELTTYMYIDI